MQAEVAAALLAYDAAVGLDASFAGRMPAMLKALQAAEQARDNEPPLAVSSKAIVSRQGQRTGPARCHAKQCNDEMLCGRCGLTWGVNDDDPPPCAPVLVRGGGRV